MLTLFWIVFWAGLAVLVLAAGLSLHIRRKEALASSAQVVDDEAIEQILRTGELRVEDSEPLDQDEIDDEEKRFWSESWDEPTDWGGG